MHTNRCGASCCGPGCVTRRQFLGASVLAAGSVLVGGCAAQPTARRPGGAAGLPKVVACGPASKCTPAVRAAFVRRKGDYGIRWPGAIYDGEAARKTYTQKLEDAARTVGAKLDLRPEPIYSAAEADAWIAESIAARPHGLVLVLLDRQNHAWPTVDKAIASGLPTVVLSPIGTSFTTNTAGPSKKPGAVIYSTDDLSRVDEALKLIAAGAKMRAARAIVIRGRERKDETLADLGIALRYVPASVFAEEYGKVETNEQVLALADQTIRGSRLMRGATADDVINGAKSYLAAARILEREEGDAITMDCLGALGHTKISLPCLAWSRMNDDRIPAACEADLGAVATHMIIQYLCDRPGFQQDPVAETSRRAIIGAHCSCPTRLAGFDQPSEPYDILHHHGNRDAVPRTIWRVGQRITSADVLPCTAVQPTRMLIAGGQVIDNVSVPPAGGCVVSVMVRFDKADDVLAWPGFHQVFFYGDFVGRLTDFCRLHRIEPQIV